MLTCQDLASMMSIWCLAIMLNRQINIRETFKDVLYTCWAYIYNTHVYRSYLYMCCVICGSLIYTCVCVRFDPCCAQCSDGSDANWIGFSMIWLVVSIISTLSANHAMMIPNHSYAIDGLKSHAWQENRRKQIVYPTKALIVGPVRVPAWSCFSCSNFALSSFTILDRLSDCQKVFDPAPHSTALVQTPVQLLLPFTVWASLRCSHPTVYRLPWGNCQKYSKRAWITPFGSLLDQSDGMSWALSCCCESFVDVFWDKKHLPMNCTHSRHSKNWPKRLPWSCPTADRFPMTSIPTVGDTGVSRMNIRIQQTTSNRTYLCIKGPI